MVAVILTGCNTFKGFGQDVSKAGDAVTNTAEDQVKYSPI
jgi:predicted small secreted protein